MKTLIITGSTGMLGSNLAFKAADRFDVFGLDIEVLGPHMQHQVKVDLTDPDQVEKIVGEISPDYIVHCAAMTDVDLCERVPSRAQAVNALATKNLVKAAGQCAKFVYISTGSVFNGEKGGYVEQDVPMPCNTYAQTKLEGELFVEESGIDYVIVRTDIIGWDLIRGRSFIEWIYNNLSQKIKINMFTDVIFTPVSVMTLSDHILKILENDFVGRLNIGVSQPLSKYDLGVKLADALGLDRALIMPGSITGHQFAAKRPKNTSLNTQKLKDIFGSVLRIDEEVLKLAMMKRVSL